MTTSPLAGNVPRHQVEGQRPKGISPAALVRQRVFAPGAPYNANERLIAAVIAEHLGADGIAWPGQKTIALRTGLSERTVRNHLPGITKGPHALFAVSYPGESRGRAHRSLRYEVISSPGKFKESRKRIESEWFARTTSILGGPKTGILKLEYQELREEFQRKKIDLQRHMLYGSIDEDDYQRGLLEVAVDVLVRSGLSRRRARSEAKRHLEATTPAPGAD